MKTQSLYWKDTKLCIRVSALIISAKKIVHVLKQQMMSVWLAFVAINALNTKKDC